MRTLVLLTLCVFLASCEVATALGAPVARRSAEAVTDPKAAAAAADANHDGTTSTKEWIMWLLLGTGTALGTGAAAFMKAHSAQKEVDQQWDAKLADAKKAAEAAKS